MTVKSFFYHLVTGPRDLYGFQNTTVAVASRHLYFNFGPLKVYLFFVNPNDIFRDQTATQKVYLKVKFVFA